jgi:hypothetical protein
MGPTVDVDAVKKRKKISFLAENRNAPVQPLARHYTSLEFRDNTPQSRTIASFRVFSNAVLPLNFSTLWKSELLAVSLNEPQINNIYLYCNRIVIVKLFISSYNLSELWDTAASSYIQYFIFRNSPVESRQQGDYSNLSPCIYTLSFHVYITHPTSSLISTTSSSFKDICWQVCGPQRSIIFQTPPLYELGASYFL